MALIFELALAPADSAGLGQFLGRRSRPGKLSLIWHDNGDGELAARGLALAERREGRVTSWHLEQVQPSPGAAAVLAEAAMPDALGHALPTPLLPVAGFMGTRRVFQMEGLELTLLEGEIRAVTESLPICRLHLAGPPDAVIALARDIAGSLRLSVPADSMVAEALTAARRPFPATTSGMPKLSPDLSIGAACALICSHLTAAILRRGEHIAVGDAVPTEPEHVHQMRVALRRLRSGLTLFVRALPCAELDEALAGLKALGTVLAPARDWDVFTGSTAQAVGEAFAGDAAIARLMGAAERRRTACHATLRAYLAGPDYRRLGLTLAALAACPPWDRTDPMPDAEAAGEAVPEDTQAGEDRPDDLVTFAAKSLSRSLRRVLAPGDDIDAMPEEELHAIRLRAKRLRYAAEMFAPLFPRRDTTRFLRRLGELQEILGHLNDGAVAAGLMAQLGGATAHGFGAGAVRGFIAANTPDTRRAIAKSWRRLHRTAPFWE